MKRVFILIFAIFVFGHSFIVLGMDECSWTNEGTWARYQTGKLSRIISAHSYPGMDNAHGVDYGNDPVKARVTYMGEYRPTSEESESFISDWLKSLGHSEDASVYAAEFLFIEDGRKYWLPVQNNVVPYLLKELKGGENVDLLALWIGRGYPRNGTRQHIIVVNEFCKPQQYASARAIPPPASIGDNSPFTARYIGGDRAPEIEVTNNAGITFNLALNNSRYMIAPSTSRKIILEPGTYTYQATAPSVRPLEGEKEFQRGYVYTWEFYVVTRTRTSPSSPSVIPRRRGRRRP